MSGPSPDPHPGEGEPLLPPDWQELAPLLDAVLDAAPEHRAARILELSVGPHRARQAELPEGPLEDRAGAPALETPSRWSG